VTTNENLEMASDNEDYERAAELFEEVTAKSEELNEV
jgi:hypothetical protein